MDETYHIRVVGSGPIALFTCWCLSNNNNHVDIVSDRLVGPNHEYRIFLDSSYLPGGFTPNVLPSSALLDGKYDLFVVCATPSRSLAIADELQSSNSESIVLILSTYSSTIFDSLVPFRNTRFYAWPLVSVEAQNRSIYSTNLLHLLLYQDYLDDEKLAIFTNILKPTINLSLTSSTKVFLARSVLTFALYSFLFDLGTHPFALNPSSLCNYCTPLVLQISAKKSISAADFPGFSPSLSLEIQLNRLFSELIPSSMASPASRHNLLYLRSNRTKLKRYMSDLQDLL